MAEVAHAPARRAVHYQRRRPEDSVLYQVVQEHVETFFADVQAQTGSALPKFIREEFDSFLECGILAHGFLRLRCGECGHEKLLAFSCKGRAFCPSCGARRMAQTAAYLVDEVIPEVPVRQWVLSFPIPLRLMYAAQPELLTSVLAIVHREITRFLRRQAGFKDAQTGAVTLIQRFGSAGNVNVHLHGLVLDGVYRRTEAGLVFHAVTAPTPEELDAILGRIITALMKQLTRTGHLVEEEGMSYLREGGSDPVLTPLQWASCTYRIAYGPHAGQAVLRLPGAPRLADAVKPGCVTRQGFSLHAGIRCGAHQRSELERLCRYITRPTIANERRSRSPDGDVILQLKTPWRDGTSHLKLPPWNSCSAWRPWSPGRGCI
jgi:Putative transposase/Transposase zinc-binding domain